MDGGAQAALAAPSTAMPSPIPPGFQQLALPEQGYLLANGPLWGKREGEKLLLGLRVEQRHCNPAKICHGGMLMSFADFQLALGSNFEKDLKRFLPTINLSMDYLAPAPRDCWLWGRTDVMKVTKTLVFAQCLLYADDAPVARASAVMKLTTELDPRLDLRRLLEFQQATHPPS